ncbi:MAG: radical SAM protein [Massiliimalia sp.]|jgi:wyosine [tRNA(Phe)-imidazoG37] synthetase (radical SAM superfamily)
MNQAKYLFGPVPSRRLGKSLGVSPIPEKTCNYSCIYCQLGRTNHMTVQRQEFFPLDEIIEEFRCYLQGNPDFDVVTIVGEGEPTLYSRLGELILQIKQYTDKPVAVITNGALLTDPQVRQELLNADMVLPSLDAYDEGSFRMIDRPCGLLDYQQIQQGLIDFSKEYQGQLWIEIMLIGGINDDDTALDHFSSILSQMRYDRVYINSPVRPPAEGFVHTPAPERIQAAVQKLSGISIDMLVSGSFFSELTDPYDAVLSICRRHPMNQFELDAFLDSRNVKDKQQLKERLEQDSRVEPVTYKGIITYRVK